MSSIDKEAQEKMGDIIYEVLKEEGIVENRAFITDIVSEALYKAGYRKPPEGEPPLLSDNDEVLAGLWKQAQKETQSPMCEYDATEFAMILVAQAQRQSDIKWWREK